MKARLFTDGGARGNPGPAAAAYVLEDAEGSLLAAHGEAIGTTTNNVAEYRALLAGLAKAKELGVDELEVVSDSELLVKQMRGEYKVKNPALRELNAAAEALAARRVELVVTEEAEDGEGDFAGAEAGTAPLARREAEAVIEALGFLCHHFCQRPFA